MRQFQKDGQASKFRVALKQAACSQKSNRQIKETKSISTSIHIYIIAPNIHFSRICLLTYSSLVNYFSSAAKGNAGTPAGNKAIEEREREKERTIEYVKFAGNLVFFDTIFVVVRDIRTK